MPVYQQPLIDAISGIMSQDRQAKLDARQAAADERAARLSDLQYQTALDDQNYKKGLRAYVADNMQPVTTYKDVANPAYQNYLDAHTPEALAYAQGNIPKKAVEGGWEAPIYEANPDPRVELQLGYANGPAPAQTFQQATTTAPSYLKLAMDYAQQNGRPDEAMKLHDQVMSEAGKQTALLGTHQAGVDYYNRVMGTNVKFMGVDKDGFISFENNKDVYKMNPNTGALELFRAGHEPDTKETWSEPFEMNVGGKKAMVQKSSHGQVRPVIQDSPKININTVSTPDQVESDARAILEGTLAPSGLSKRNGHDVKVRAAVRAMNPGFNFTEADANAAYQKNPTVNRQYVNLEAVKTPIRELGALGQKLNNSNLVPANRWKQTILANTGDKDIIAYRAKRNSVIQELANAMRGAGISEGSIQLELQNFSDAYSPAQLEAAVNSTLEVINAKQGAIRTKPFGGATPPHGVKTKSDPLGIL